MARIKPIGIRELIDSVSEEIMQETGSFPQGNRIKIAKEG
jgi:hypothetical protein